MEQVELHANNRDSLGKKVRFLRRKGITPVHLFGHNVESLSLQCETMQLKQVLAQAGKTKIISFIPDKAKKPRNVVVRNIQRDVITGELLHVDFYQVSMAEKIKVEVPIVPVGEAPALNIKENMLLQELSNLTVECLPDKIPTRIEMDLSSLTEADQAIHVRDLPLDEGVTVITDPEHLVVKISQRRGEKEEGEKVGLEAEAVEAPKAAQPPEGEPKEK